MAALLCMTGVALVEASHADACSLVPLNPAPGAVALGATSVPLTGPFVAFLSCNDPTYCASATPEMSAMRDGVSVPGRTEILRGAPEAQTMFVLLWPDEPLDEGAHYDVRMLAGDQENGVRDVIASAGATADAVALEDIPATLATYRRPIGEEFCCDTNRSCGFANCFTEAVHIDGEVTPTLPTYEDQMLVLYRLRSSSAPRPSADEGWTIGPRIASLHFEEHADEYCFTLESLDLTDGTIRTNERCLEDDRALAIGTEPTRTFDGNEFTFDCDSPPLSEEGTSSEFLTDEWCSEFEQYCGKNANACTTSELAKSRAERCSTSSKPGGCSMSGRPGDLSSGLYAMLAALGLIVARRKRSVA